MAPWQGCCVNLKQRPDAIDKLALWLHAEWLKGRGRTQLKLSPAEAFESRKKQIVKHLGPATIPATFVALAQADVASTVIGCVSLTRLVSRNKRFRQGLWVTNLFVVPTARAMGVGTALLACAERYAHELQQNQLYLYTKSSERYYLQLGWSTVVEPPLGGHSESRRIIMAKTL